MSFSASAATATTRAAARGVGRRGRGCQQAWLSSSALAEIPAPAPTSSTAPAVAETQYKPPSAAPSARLAELRARIRKEGSSLQSFAQPPPSKAAAQPSPLHLSHQPAVLLDEDEDESPASALGPLASVERPPLTDSFGRQHTYLRISLTERCNLRCTYCMPAEGVQLQAQDRLLSTDEILRIAELFVRVGVTKIRLTGGEPLVRKDLVSLTRSLKALGLTELAVTTNGVAPASKYADLVAAGMTHFNISLDTLQPARFASISRRPAKYLEAVQANLAQLLGPLGVGGRVKINNVVMRGVNDDELADFVALTAEQELDVRFIEWMPFDSNGWNKKTFVPYTEMISRLQEAFHSVARAVDAPHDTTKWWRVPGYKGRVGFITSMSQHFCGSCNRLRVTADGKLKVCLFGAEDLSLRDALREGRTEEELLGMVGRAVGLKKFSLGGQEDMFALAKSKNRPMILIGG